MKNNKASKLVLTALLFADARFVKAFQNNPEDEAADVIEEATDAVDGSIENCPYSPAWAVARRL